MRELEESKQTRQKEQEKLDSKLRQSRENLARCEEELSTLRSAVADTRLFEEAKRNVEKAQAAVARIQSLGQYGRPSMLSTQALIGLLFCFCLFRGCF